MLPLQLLLLFTTATATVTTFTAITTTAIITTTATATDNNHSHTYYSCSDNSDSWDNNGNSINPKNHFYQALFRYFSRSFEGYERLSCNRNGGNIFMNK